jgi:hypothetical protein
MKMRKTKNCTKKEDEQTLKLKHLINLIINNLTTTKTKIHLHH